MTKITPGKSLELLTIIVSVLIAGYLLNKSAYITSLGYYPEISAELIAAFVSLSVFGMTWFAYGKSKDNHSLFLGATFLVIGLLALFHTFSYPFMPDFITRNSTEKAMNFHTEAWLVSALLFFASAYIYKDTLPMLINKPVLLASALALSFISLVFTLLYTNNIAYYLRGGLSYVLHALTFVLIVCTCYLYTRRSSISETNTNYNNNNTIFLIYGFIIIASGHLVYFFDDFSGHLLKIAGFFYIHLALYRSSVELPYEKLAIAEEKLRNAAEEKYRNLVDYANDAIITTDLEDRVTSWNRSAEENFGWTEQEIMGKKLSQLIVPPNLLAERKRILTNTLTGKTFSGIETVRLRKDGSKIDASMTISPLRDADKNIIGYSGIIRDITERKKAEETSLENLRLEYISKAKSEFLTTMSHELRTPLNAVIGFSELLKQGVTGGLNEKQQHFIANILTSAKHLLNLINDILDLSKIEAGKIGLVIEKISVPATIEETITLIKVRVAEHNIQIQKDFDPQLELIEADKLRFKQILFNLLDNAIKFSKEEGGTITISTKRMENMAQLSVSDTGIGIKEEEVGKLFRRFEQLDSGSTRKYGGTGLGLSISKQLVELHGGKIWAESKYGEGSTFTFVLPLNAKITK